MISNNEIINKIFVIIISMIILIILILEIIYGESKSINFFNNTTNEFLLRLLPKIFKNQSINFPINFENNQNNIQKQLISSSLTTFPTRGEIT